MHNRVETLRMYIEDILFDSTDDIRMRFDYINHIVCVSQFCALIALKRGEDAELATMAGLLHDIYTLTYLDSEKHAKRGAVLARDVLNKLRLTTEEETDMICSAIHTHSKKRGSFTGFSEVLIDADVLQHSLYNVTFPLIEKDKERFNKLADEFELDWRRK